MQLRMLSGPYDGEVREFPPHIAKSLLEDGRAERVDGVEPERTLEIETAAVGPPEDAALRKGRAKPRKAARKRSKLPRPPPKGS